MLFRHLLAVILSLSFPFWTNQQESAVKEEQGKKTVLLSILARNKAHVLPTFLQCIDNLDYDKSQITVYINTNNNEDNTEEILQTWAKENGQLYRQIIFESHKIENMPETKPHEWLAERWNILANIRQKSLRKTKEYGCDYYFVVDCDVFIAPCTLKELVSKDKPIIAPMVRTIPDTNDLYSNYFYDIDNNGYFKEHPDYYKVIHQEMVGTFKVPLVHQVYLIQSSVIDNLTYLDNSKEWEFIIFSRNARLNNIEQYLCNEQNFGTFLHFPELSLEEETHVFQCILNIQPKFDITDFRNFGPQTEKAIVAQQLETKLSCLEESVNNAHDSDTMYDALLQSAQLREQLNYPQEDVIKAYKQAFYHRPTDVAPLHFLSLYQRNIEKYDNAYETAQEGLKLTLFHPTDHWISNHGMLWEFSLCAWSIGKFEEAIDASKKLLLNPRLSEEQKAIVKRNISYFKPGISSLADAREKWGAPPWENPEFEKKARPDLSFTVPSNPKLHICTVATYDCANLRQLEDSCKARNMTLDILGMGTPFTFSCKLDLLKEHLEKIPENDVVMFIDAFDTLVLADEQTILEKFNHFDMPIVFSVETSCHPFIHLNSYFPHSPTKFKYLNSGSYIGYAGCLKQILEELSPVPAETDDQGLFSVYYLYHPHNIALDYTSELFIALWRVKRDELYFDSSNQKVESLTTATTPCVVHANSNTTPMYQEAYDKLFRQPR